MANITQSSAHLKQLYYDLLRIRSVEERLASRYAEQKIRCPMHLSIGQEAIAVGVCSYLQKKDIVMSTHRAHAHYLAKGGSLKALIAEMYGKESGCCEGRGGSMHLFDESVGFMGSTPIVGGSFPVAVGMAFANQMKESNNHTAIFFGEAMTEEGVFAEALNFASLKKIPILFICESNVYSVYSPLDVRQPSERSICSIAKAHGIPARKGDGNSMQEILDCMEEIHPLSLKGPALLELTTYRWREHCGPNYDNHIGYRTEQEFLSWKEKCPLSAFEKELLKNSILTIADIEESKEQIDKEIQEAFFFAEESPFPSEKKLTQYIYAR